MRGIALALVGLALSMFAGALYIASALKPSSPAEDAWAGLPLSPPGAQLTSRLVRPPAIPASSSW